MPDLIRDAAWRIKEKLNTRRRKLPERTPGMNEEFQRNIPYPGPYNGNTLKKRLKDLNERLNKPGPSALV